MPSLKAMSKAKKAYHKEQTIHNFSQRERLKRLSKSLCDLPNFKREIDDKLKGKLPKPLSTRWSGETRKLGETQVSRETDDFERSLATRDCRCVLQANIELDESNVESRDSYETSTSEDVKKLRDIVEEHTKSADFISLRQKTLKVDDVILTASKLEAEYSQRAKTPACSCTRILRNPFRNRSVSEWIHTSQRSKTSSARLKKTTLVVKIPGSSDNLNDYNCKETWGRARSNFSYRHKR